MDQGARQVRQQNPVEKASILSILTFFYTYPIFKKGRRRPLDDGDVYEVTPKFASNTLGDNLEGYWESERRRKGKEASVIRVLISCFANKYLFAGFIQLCVSTSLMIIQPLAISKFVKCFTSDQTDISRNDLYKYAALIIGSNILGTVYDHNYMQYIVEYALVVRTSFASLIYRKALKLKPSAFSDTTMGNIVTLITKDVGAFEGCLIFLNNVWIGTLQTILVSYLIFLRIGWSVLAGVGFLVLIIPLQVYIGHISSLMRLKAAKKTDDRLQGTTEAFSAIKIVKMYTWENYFEKTINEYRKKETNTLAIIFYLKGLLLVIGNLVSRVSIFLLIMTYTWTGHLITAEIVAFVISTYFRLNGYINYSLPLGVFGTADLYASIRRIQKFLNSDELKDNQQTKNVSEPRVLLRNISVKLKNVEILKDVSLSVNKGLHIISGNVGSGKSVILKTIMKEYPISKGQLLVEGTISYASQEPWLFPSTIKQNILFGQPCNERRYQEVLNVCALTFDISQFENGDQTVVGDRGVNLSKGQQARINLARAVYQESDIYLLDECLSAVDTHVNTFVFKNCIKRFLKDKIVLLVTNNINHIKQVYGRNVLYVDKGNTLSIEQQKETIDKRITYYIDDVDFDYFEGEKEDDVPSEDTQVDDETSQLLHQNSVNERVKNFYHEAKQPGKVNLSVYLRYYKYTGGILVLLLILVLSVVVQVAASYTDKLLSKWVNIEPQLTNYIVNNLTNSTDYEKTLERRYLYTHLYTVIIILGTVLMFVKSFSNVYFCLKASRNLHKSIVSSVLNSFMIFFDSHFIGNIINRFSKDLAIIDEEIPYIIYENFRCILLFTATIVMIASVNTIFLLPAGFLILTLYFVRRLYIPTGRAIKRLESSTRSPMIGYLNATLEGLTTARAYEKQTLLIDEYDRHQDLYTSSYYMIQCTTRALGFALDIVCSIFIAAVVLQFVFFGNGTIRSNIDPTQRYADATIWEAIEKINLKHIVTNLQEEIHGGGTNYSSGQRQLICLARALVSKNKIIVLDEATASMDPETCALLQDTIKKNFADCTVITIAHRLNTISNSDKVMVVDGGEIVEYDTPDVLMTDKNGLFFGMIRQAGVDIH